MQYIDDFAKSLLEESKHFLEKCDEHGDQIANTAYLHAALMLAFCSLEAHVNMISDEFANSADISLHDKGILLERDVHLDDGRFVLTPAPKIIRLEDRIQFLHTRFSGKALDRNEVWWSRLSDATKLRNQLTHPREHILIKPEAVERALKAVIDTIDALYRALYKRPFPVAIRGLTSELTF